MNTRTLEPVAWGMPRQDGTILDVICSEEHARCAGEYTVPLYAAPQPKAERPAQEPVANNPDPYHLSRILHELAGAASMCWQHVDRAGVFQSTRAAEFVAAAIAEIRQRMKDAAPQPRPEVELTDEEIQKLAHVYDNTAPWTLMGFARAVIEAYRAKQGEMK